MKQHLPYVTISLLTVVLLFVSAAYYLEVQRNQRLTRRISETEQQLTYTQNLEWQIQQNHQQMEQYRRQMQASDQARFRAESLVKVTKGKLLRLIHITPTK